MTKRSSFSSSASKSLSAFSFNPFNLIAIFLFATFASALANTPSGLTARPNAKPFLSMPDRADGRMPPVLSQTGAFKDVAQLVPSDSLIPYDLNVPFWSDGADKSRWVSIPSGTVEFSPQGEWKFPPGTVFVKHFEMPLGDNHSRRLETRLLVCDSAGGVYGVTYKWRADDSDADLLTTNLTEPIAAGNTQTWYYPSREDCMICHTRLAGLVLGVKTRQLNRTFHYPSGIDDNQIRAWAHIGLFGSPEPRLTDLPRLAHPNDHSRTLEDRARSWLDANCAHCHRPGGTVANFDARYDTPLAAQNLIDGPVLIDEGIDNARTIAPRDPWRSIILLRASALDGVKMPPLAHNAMDTNNLGLLKDWINSLPGDPVLPPPIITPPGGSFPGQVTVNLSQVEPGAAIHYTLDGSRPGKSDPIYDHPITITQPTIVRARAFKPGFVKSIAAQQVFIIDASSTNQPSGTRGSH